MWGGIAFFKPDLVDFPMWFPFVALNWIARWLVWLLDRVDMGIRRRGGGLLRTWLVEGAAKQTKAYRDGSFSGPD